MLAFLALIAASTAYDLHSKYENAEELKSKGTHNHHCPLPIDMLIPLWCIFIASANYKQPRGIDEEFDLNASIAFWCYD